MPTVSSFQAACSTSRRAWLMAMRASAMRSRLPPRLAIGLPKADPAGRALAGELEGHLGQADEAHAVVHAARAEAALGDLEGAARAGEDAAGRQRARRSKVTSPWPSGSSYWPSAVSIRSTVTPGASSGTSTIECWRCRCGVGVGEAHEDADLAVGVADAGRPPLAAVEHDLVAVEDGRGLHVGGVGGGDAGLGHQERAADRARRAAARATRCCCSGEPYCSSTSMLPVSGALQLKTSGASGERPICSAIGA